MTFFESLLGLLLVAIVLLQVARRVHVPYPAMLAVAGVAVAFVPGAPTISIDPELILALFVAPVLMDAGYDFPLSTVRLLWKPMLFLVAGAVAVTTATVAFIGWWAAGLPIAAACVLGAIVAPPDAAAAVAVLGAVSLPRRTVELLQGESLFNDAIALLIFGAALAVQAQGSVGGHDLLRLATAVPGGILLGVVLGLVIIRINAFVSDTLGGNLLQFLNSLVVWIVAERLQLSAVLAVVASAMTVANAPMEAASPRMRVHSYAVWATVVFFLNVLAFLLMGLQARAIVGHFPIDRLWQAARIAVFVVAAVVAVRMIVVMTWYGLSSRLPVLRGHYRPPTVAQAAVVGWSGMRGIVTLATAFALPADFPQRDLVVLVAFAVVLGTLVVQGLTLGPVIKALGLHRMEDGDRERAEARSRLSAVAVNRLGGLPARFDLTLGEFHALSAVSPASSEELATLDGHRQLGIEVARTKRSALMRMRGAGDIDTDTFYDLLEEIDWSELGYLSDEGRHIQET